MARDYKHAANRRQKSNPLPGWVWGMAGLAIGLFAALLVYLDAQRPEREAAAMVAPASPPQQARQESREVRRPAPETPPRPRFDFYTLLPELEVVVPEPEVAPAPPGAPAPKPMTVEQPGLYMLQAGSFRRQQEADRLKASLAFLGVEASIQQVKVNADTWHRVRIGPFRDLKELNRVRERLHANQIQTLLMKLPESG